MEFLKKFKKLINLKKEEVEIPDYIWLTYAVCVVEDDACGWGGWMLEAAFKKKKPKEKTDDFDDRVLSAQDEQICPVCGKETFRTEVSVRYTPSKNQKLRAIAGVDYKVARIKYK